MLELDAELDAELQPADRGAAAARLVVLFDLETLAPASLEHCDAALNVELFLQMPVAFSIDRCFAIPVESESVRKIFELPLVSRRRSLLSPSSFDSRCL